MDATDKFAVRAALELAALKLERLNRESRLIGDLAKIKDDEAMKSIVALSIDLDIELNELMVIVSNAMLIAKGLELES